MSRKKENILIKALTKQKKENIITCKLYNLSNIIFFLKIKSVTFFSESYNLESY